ncbi:GerAB/ArcD/ProY family transporter [Paenibacillus beijingensis]|uniref:Spore gernimation protein n=1 Tax=Paenibacillus beijingensis TaxID=1126833 RepID=A0A0D5NEF0_9BACL|nr:endospore germination permease [Paenibacillus beijingensis]AJY73540.1 spore gernimation protein [Paenibacillus beijingensis]
MNKQETVSSIQMAMLFLTYVTASAIVNIPAPLTGAAKNGAWISILLACTMGMLILACVLYLHRQYPGLTFIEYTRKAIGRWLTIIVAIPFLCSAFLQLANIVIDIGGFFSTSMLRSTPNYVVQSIFFFMAALTARAGIEVMARMSVLLIISMLGFVIAVLLMVSPYFHPDYLLPVMPNGIKPILHGAYIAYGFPYGEVTLFAAMLPFVRVKERPKIGKYLFLAIIVNGFTLLTSVVCSIMANGPLVGELKYSLFQLARLINIQEIIERIESVIGFSLIAGSYMKASIQLFILTNVLSQLLKLQDERLLTFPIAFVCLLLSLTMFKDEMEFVETVSVIWPLLLNVTYVLPLLLIVAVTLIKRMISAR